MDFIHHSRNFKAFLNALNPEFWEHLPTRKTVSTTILKDVYNSVISDEKLLVNSKSRIQADSWKNPSSIRNFTKKNGSKKHIFGFFRHGELKTGESLAEAVNNSEKMATETASFTDLLLFTRSSFAKIWPKEELLINEVYTVYNRYVEEMDSGEKEKPKQYF